MQEGELRPQLLDRFGMSVNVTTLLDVDVRTQMVLDKMAYEEVSHLICLGMCLMLHGTAFAQPYCTARCVCGDLWWQACKSCRGLRSCVMMTFNDIMLIGQ